MGKTFFNKLKANIFFKKEDYNKALALYEKYNKSCADDYDVLINMATIHKNFGDFTKAQKLYLKLANEDSDNIYFLFELAKLSYLITDYKTALNACLKIEEKIGINSALAYLISSIYRQTEKNDLAKEYMPYNTEDQIQDGEQTILDLSICI